jgi:MobA/MobL family
LALPHELGKSQRVELVRAFSKDIADRYQVAVDFAIHEPHRNGDERNHHAHVLTTTRVIEPGGLGEKSEIEWSDTNRRKAELVPGKEEIANVRERWAELTNEFLKEQGLEARVDHRSLESQGIEREPTSHLGPAVSGMERRGIETEVGKRLEREAQSIAQERLEQAAEAGRLEREQQALQRSILDLSGDLERARRERGGMRQSQGPAPNLDQIRTEAAQRWLAMREQEKAREQAQEQTPKSSAAEQSPPLSLDEQRRQAAERWAEYRAQALEHPERQREKDREQGLDQGLDGPEID